MTRRMNDLQIIERLGSGSFGVAYKVRDKISGELMVLKQI